jgi:hypothetical protein
VGATGSELNMAMHATEETSETDTRTATSFSVVPSPPPRRSRTLCLQLFVLSSIALVEFAWLVLIGALIVRVARG